MLLFLKNLKNIINTKFSNYKKPESTSFEINDRFENISEEYYEAINENDELNIRINKKNLFVWIDGLEREYRDFVLDYSFSISKKNGYSSTGFLLKKNEDSDYYYFLISNKGYFRFDIVFNSTPSILIPWTECKEYLQKKNRVKIISFESQFVFFLNDKYIGEISDEQIEKGSVAFAAQNYDEKDLAKYKLKSFKINSKISEVEKENSSIKEKKLSEKSKILGDSFFSIGRYNLAAIQYNKIENISKNREVLFKLASSYFNLRIFDAALLNYEKAYKLKKDEKYAEQIASCLYALNKYIELRDFVNETVKLFDKNALLLNLLGNAEYNLGNFEKSSAFYLEAIEIENNNPDYLLNAADILLKLNKNKKALDYFVQAAKEFFKKENYSEIYNIYNIVSKIDFDNIEVKAIYGKILFHEGKYFDADKIFAGLIKKKYTDSSIYYLQGLIKSFNNDKKAALALYKKALKIEPNYYLYLFRYAETAFINGKDIKKEINKCLKLAADDFWVLNLAGQYYKSLSDLKKAKEYFSKAFEVNPTEIDILVNYSDLLFEMGDVKKAFSLLEKRPDHWKILNLKGVFFSKLGVEEKACNNFEKALVLSPDNIEIMENLSSSALVCFHFTRAEDLALKVLEKRPSADIYNIIANISYEKGEYNRAEAAYNEAISFDDKNSVYKLNLAELYFSRTKYKEAEKLIKGVLEEENNSRAAKMLENVESRIYKKYTCSSCSIEWIVPKNIPVQTGVRIMGEPPGEAPAGQCPDCGKIFCVNCAKDFLKDKRFVCSDCQSNLRMSDDSLKYLLNQYLDLNQE